MIRHLCMALAGVLLLASPVWASPGLCTGPVCADGITRSAKNHWQLAVSYTHLTLPTIYSV